MPGNKSGVVLPDPKDIVLLGRNFELGIVAPICIASVSMSSGPSKIYAYLNDFLDDISFFSMGIPWGQNGSLFVEIALFLKNIAKTMKI